MNSGLTSARALKDIAAQISKIWLTVAKSIEPRTAALGSEPPSSEARGKFWVKTDANGVFDGVFTWNTSATNWYTRVDGEVGSICLFQSSTSLKTGWEVVNPSTLGLTPVSGYEWRKFSGTGLLVISGVCYRRWDQPA